MEDRIAGYFKAFNSGDEKVMAAFLNENLSSEALKRRPVTEQIGFYRQVREEMQTISASRFLRAGESEINVLVETQKGD